MNVRPLCRRLGPALSTLALGLAIGVGDATAACNLLTPPSAITAAANGTAEVRASAVWKLGGCASPQSSIVYVTWSESNAPHRSGRLGPFGPVSYGAIGIVPQQSISALSPADTIVITLQVYSAGGSVLFDQLSTSATTGRPPPPPPPPADSAPPILSAPAISQPTASDPVIHLSLGTFASGTLVYCGYELDDGQSLPIGCGDVDAAARGWSGRSVHFRQVQHSDTGVAAISDSNTVTVPPPATVSGQALVVGALVEGATLTVQQAACADAVRTTFDWLRDGVPVDTGMTHVLTALDADAGIRVVQTCTNVYGSGATSSPIRTTAPVPVPAPERPPVILGDPVTGSTVTATTGDWTPASGVSFGFQWRRCLLNGDACQALPGGGAAYTVEVGDQGHALRVAVTGTTAFASGLAVSEPAVVRTPLTADVRVRPSTDAARGPRITGPPLVGQQLSLDVGSWDGSPPLRAAVVWRACSPQGTSCRDLPGDTPALTLTDDLIGHAVTARVTMTNDAGAGVADAAPTASITRPGASLPPPTCDASGCVWRIGEARIGLRASSGERIRAGRLATLTGHVDVPAGWALPATVSVTALPTVADLQAARARGIVSVRDVAVRADGAFTVRIRPVFSSRLRVSTAPTSQLPSLGFGAGPVHVRAWFARVVVAARRDAGAPGRVRDLRVRGVIVPRRALGGSLTIEAVDSHGAMLSLCSSRSWASVRAAGAFVARCNYGGLSRRLRYHLVWRGAGADAAVSPWAHARVAR